jgi:hypothetical protein
LPKFPKKNLLRFLPCLIYAVPYGIVYSFLTASNIVDKCTVLTGTVLKFSFKFELLGPDCERVYIMKVEGVLNGILSMLALVEGDKKEGLILSFCEKLSQATNNQVGLVCLKVL